MVTLVEIVEDHIFRTWMGQEQDNQSTGSALGVVGVGTRPSTPTLLFVLVVNLLLATKKNVLFVIGYAWWGTGN